MAKEKENQVLKLNPGRKQCYLVNNGQGSKSSTKQFLALLVYSGLNGPVNS